MTAVQRLQFLPAPGTTPAGQAGAAPGREEQQVRPVVPARFVQRGLQDPRDSQGVARSHSETPQVERRVADRRLRDREAAQAGLHDSGSGRRASGPGGNAGAGLTAPATGRSYGFSQFSSLPFLVQVLGQEGLTAGRLAAPQTSLSSHRDAAQLGSDIYRKSGGEPEFLPETATFVRLAV
jgi:hypothetical protein